MTLSCRFLNASGIESLSLTMQTPRGRGRSGALVRVNGRPQSEEPLEWMPLLGRLSAVRYGFRPGWRNYGS